MSWTLEYGELLAPVSHFGISNIRRTRRNLLTDRVTFSVAGNSLLATPTFAANSSLKIFRDGSKWFDGIVTQIPLHCSPKYEFYEYEISGVWWYLENIVYQQAWKESTDYDDPSPALSNVYKSRIILGQNVDGTLVTIGEQISDVLGYGIACGANLQIGDVDISVNIPLDECKDLSCADVIRRLLRWVPDTVCYIDYGESIPRISFRRRSQMPSISLNIMCNVSEFSLQPRHDLQVPAVVLKFETTNSVNGKSWKELISQKYPTTCTGSELKALVLTINLEGSKASCVVQDIVTTPIDISSASWWQAHVPGIASLHPANVSIGDASRTSSLPNELISGTVAPWMDKAAETDVIRCKISYSDGNEAVIDREVAVRIVATDASSGIYRKLTSLATGESMPVGLAEQIYNAVNPLQYDGSLAIVAQEVDADYFGKVLNLSGGQSAWTAMNAVVQEVIEYLDAGKTVIRFGPAKHLGASDLAELTRSGRLLFESKNYNERTTAEVSGNGIVEQGTHGRVDNTSFGTGKYRMIKFTDPSNSAKTVQIDTADVVLGEAIVKFRTEDVCDSGVLKKRYSLASEPYSIQ
ncbi:MAG: hypothetical protein LBI56_04010 [Puniceicoccales bacterium]|jgi:hypothetical protein|nr:hypothetical protein [Puniceicoccales bacterium]